MRIFLGACPVLNPLSEYLKWSTMSGWFIYDWIICLSWYLQALLRGWILALFLRQSYKTNCLWSSWNQSRGRGRCFFFSTIEQREGWNGLVICFTFGDFTRCANKLCSLFVCFRFKNWCMFTRHMIDHKRARNPYKCLVHGCLESYIDRKK